jgi:hypothetical protein
MGAMAWTWEFTLRAFNALGGAAENIVRKSGSAARGLVSVNPEKSVDLYVPEKLIFPASDFEFADGRLKLKDTAQIGNAERSFLENYLASVSWSEGRDEAAAFVKHLNDLPGDVRALLSVEFGMEFPGEHAPDKMEEWLFRSRLLAWRGAPALVPILELVSHDPMAKPFLEANGLSLTGKFSGEVRMVRGRLGPFSAFWRFGFATLERQTFSLPMTLETGSGLEVNIGQSINLNAVLGSMPVPQFEVNGKSVRFSCVMVGSSRNPKLSRGIFCRIVKDAGEANPDQVFDNILHINRMSFLKLLEALERHEGEPIHTLRTVARYELEAMSWCIGTREL